MLKMERVRVAYQVGPDLVHALWDVDLRVDAGEFVAVMGPSGSGKSSLVNVGAGLVVPGSGRVVVNMIDVAVATPHVRAQLRREVVGVVHQTDELDPVLTALENVALPLLLAGVRDRDAVEAAAEALSTCAVGNLEDRTRDQMSGGQRQRVALARAIVGDRRVVLADEPTAALDTVTARALVETLGRLARDRGIAVLMTTHDARLATFADRVVLLRDGQVLDQGTGPDIELRSIEVQS